MFLGGLTRRPGFLETRRFHMCEERCGAGAARRATRTVGADPWGGGDPGPRFAATKAR